VRPAAGGIAFGTGSSSGTAVVDDPAAFFSSGSWIPVAIGIVLALGTSLTKMAARPALNVLTIGAAAPVVSAVEDIGSVALSLFALLIPVLVIFAVIAIIAGFVLIIRRFRRKKRAPLPQSSS
jgi:uncharacterized membrane protein YozB (DUF420 family)